MPTRGEIWELVDAQRDRIAKIATRIRPVVGFMTARDGTLQPNDDGPLYYIKPVDLFKTSFLASPIPETPAENLELLQSITTFHTYGYVLCFKPSIAEVIARIPSDLIDRVVAFETLCGSDYGNNLHITTTKLYALKA